MASSASDRDAKDALSKLLQMGTVTEYQNEFEMLISRVTKISESLLKTIYISGLKVALQIELLRAKPTTLVEAFFLARMTETRFEDERTTTTIAKPNYPNSGMLIRPWSNPTTLGEAFSLACAVKARFTNLEVWGLLRSNPTTLGEAFFRACIIEGHFEDDNNQAVHYNVGDDDTNNYDVGYMRQPIEDEAWFIAYETDYPNANEKKADYGNNKSTQENRVLEGRDVSGEKSREVFIVTPYAAKEGCCVMSKAAEEEKECWLQQRKTRLRSFWSLSTSPIQP
ncbi:hypothetical protein Tco_1224595 [Tanacetum coccineum]